MTGNCQCGTSLGCFNLEETGACCVDGNFSNQCYNGQTQNNCQALLGGEYMGNNSTCTDELCGWSPYAGACCRGKDDCYIEEETICRSLGYTWNGSPTCIGVKCCEDDTIGGCCWEIDGHCGVFCEDLNICQCAEFNGDWNATKCGSLICPEPYGACCLGLTCTTETCGACRVLGGSWQGEGVECADSPCNIIGESGACCIAENCSITTKTSCINAGGIYHGVGSNCIGTECTNTDPTGACCILGVCFAEDVYTHLECIANGGDYQGDGVMCVDVTCVMPAKTGACCHTNYKCSEVTEDTCNNLSGTYDGDGTFCPAKNCTAPTGSCCLNYECIPGQTDAQCGDGEWEQGTDQCVDCVAPIGSGACCESPPCATNVCNCTEGTEADCLSGIYQGDDSNCASVSCEGLVQQTGACCDYSSGSCTPETEIQCNTWNYFFHGVGILCEDITCCEDITGGGDIGTCCYYLNNTIHCDEIPFCVCDLYYGDWDWAEVLNCDWCLLSNDEVGACCPDQSSATECYITTQQICSARGDTYMGTNTECGDGTICTSEGTGACCHNSNTECLDAMTNAA